MKVLRAIDDLSSLPGSTHLAIGVFDGLHIGHQAVIGRALESSRKDGGNAVVVTFDPHPVRVLRPEKAPRLLTSTRHKVKLIEKLGVDAVLLLEFTLEFSKTPPEIFIEKLVRAAQSPQPDLRGSGMDVRGKSFRLYSAARRTGSAKWGFKSPAFLRCSVDKRVVSSTLIRSAVECGDLESAAKYLGRDFTILGTVTEGRQLGRRLGFPTANLRAHNELFPPNGVYAAKAWFRENEYGGVVNIGVRPTIENETGERILELHLFDFDRADLWSRTSRLLFWITFDRNRSFPELTSFKLKFGRDAERARARLRDQFKIYQEKRLAIDPAARSPAACF